MHFVSFIVSARRSLLSMVSLPAAPLVAVVTACLFFAATLSPAPAQAQYRTASGGGSSGSPFGLVWSGRFLTGFALRQGDFLDAIAPRSAAVDAAGRIGPSSQLEEWIGGSGGNQKAVACPADSFVVGLRITDRQIDGGTFVGNVEPYCENRFTRQKHYVGTGWTVPPHHGGSIGGSFTGNSRPQSYEGGSYNCPQGQAGIGFHGRSGSFIDRIGLICGPLPAAVYRAPDAPAQSVTPSNVPPPVAPPSGPPPKQALARGSWSGYASNGRGNWGYATFVKDDRTASDAARLGCGGDSQGCKTFWTTQDQCVAYAESRTGGYWFAAGGASNERAARDNATRICGRGTAPAGSCRVVHAACH